MKKTQRNSFKLNPIAASIVLAMATQFVPTAVQAGSGWGLNSKITAPAQSVPVQTYYASSPSGSVIALDPATGLPSFDPVTTLPIKVDSGKALRKFVDTLPGFGPGAAAGVYSTPTGNNLGQYIPIANSSEKWTDGSDYYEIAAVEYAEQLHSDLPKATHLRGYVQLVTPGLIAKGVTGVSFTTFDGRVLQVVDKPHHLGPVINANSGTAVRVKFTNYLPVGGNLFLPVDKSITGAGLGPDGKTYYTENRAEIHLVGGEAPWVSAGSPHQWVAPAGETAAIAAGLGKGVSTKDVPDMVPSGDGSTTLYFPNAQSARFTFYQDRTSGLTRLNNYAGLEAGYTVTDATEKSLISTGVSGGVLNNALPADQIPLILEDKTFVPANVAQQDAKWDTAHWGQPGDLWFPHVYETNQDPTSVNGSNSVGRWDYGPWFWPIFAASAPLPSGGWDAVNNVSNASFVPESYEDTPVINGTAYPTVTIDPKAYRFRILNASNDRFFNLGLYMADSTVKAPQLDRNGNQIYDNAGNPLYFVNTEVKMAPAVADTTGAPPNPTSPFGLPYDTATSCYCQYPTMAQLLTYGFSGPTRAWPIDNRVGGAPDPTTVGPDFIAIGNDGGFLPNPVDIPSQPVTYESNRRSVTVTNVYGYGLLVGPSERTDVVVDFTPYAGQTLILYNDAPTPFPFDDQRVDYFTGVGDQTSAGGTYNTLPGYGPNTRTIMQIKVNLTNTSGTGGALNVAALTTGLQTAYKASQAAPIVPESVYNAALGTKDSDNYAHVATGSVAQPTLDFTSTPASGTVNITGVNLVSSGGQLIVGTTNIVGNAVPGSGQGYRTAPTVSFVLPSGASCATTPVATATVFNAALLSAINVVNGGSKYTVAPTVTISKPTTGTQATATATIAGGAVTGITIVNPGSGYVFATPPTITITPGKTAAGKTDKGTGATASATILDPSYQVTGVTLTTQGVACTAIPDVIFTPTNGGVGAAATVVTSGAATTQSIAVQTKAEQELFDNAGRYNSTGGVELPWTSGTTQTTVPLNYTDSPTEFIGDHEVQIWKLVDNGFWSNSMHFDFTDVQLINRVGWDGTVKAPANNEVGWKDTLRLNPLEDVVVAIRAKHPQVPFGLPASIRAQDPSIPLGATASTNLKSSQLPFLADPGVTSPDGASLLTTTVNTNVVVDNTSATSAPSSLGYDNEFTWATAVLGHSEDDYIRPVVYHPTVTAPAAPTGLAGSGGLLTWIDATPAGAAATIGNTANEVGFQVQRATITGTNVGTPVTIATLPANTTTFTDKTASGASSYQVVAFNNAGTATSTPWIEVAPPAAPTGLVAAINPTGTITLTWNTVPGAANYVISSNGVPVTTVTANGTGTQSTTITTLPLGVNYNNITVASQLVFTGVTPSVIVNSVASNAVSANLSAPAAPLAPTGLAVLYTPQGTTATLNWTDSTTAGVTGYIVQQSVNGGPFSQVGAILGKTAKTASVTVANGNTYQYQVFAQSYLYATSNFTNSPAAGPVNLLTTPVAPGVASNLTATVNSASSVGLTWTASATTGVTYVIQRHTLINGNTWTAYAPLATTAAGTTTYSDTTVAKGSTYQYGVAAQSTNATGSTLSTYALSASASVNVPTAPTIGTTAAGNPKAGSQTVKWTDNSTNETGFTVQRRTGGTAATAPANTSATWTGWTSVTTTAANTTSYADTTSPAIATGTWVEYQVVANGVVGNTTSGISTAVKTK